MKNINIILYIAIVLFTIGCSDKKEPIDSNNGNVTMLIKKEIDKLNLNANISLDKNETIKKVKKIMIKKQELFMLNDLNDSNHTIKIEDTFIEMSNVKTSLILLNFFSTWCQPCIGEIPYLIDLQNRYKKRLFVAGIIVNDTINDSNLTKLIKETDINYFISNSKESNEFFQVISKHLNIKDNSSVPLLVLFKDGEYYTHYEGAVPIEMIEYDIKKAIKKEKLK